MEIYIAQSGQDIFDVVVQKFGDLEHIFDMLRDNPQLNINSRLSSKDEITINNDDLGNIAIKNSFKRANFIVVNSDEETLQGFGDFNNDFNNDFS